MPLQVQVRVRLRERVAPPSKSIMTEAGWSTKPESSLRASVVASIATNAAGGRAADVDARASGAGAEGGAGEGEVGAGWGGAARSDVRAHRGQVAGSGRIASRGESPRCAMMCAAWRRGVETGPADNRSGAATR